MNATPEICARLRRIEGQIRGIHGMLQDGRSCEQVITQLLAARAALDRVTANLVSAHVDDCLSALPPDEARTTISRAVYLLSKMPPSGEAE